MTGRLTDDDRIRGMIPLRVSNDLTLDETDQVDQLARYDEAARREIAAFQECLATLRTAAEAPLPVDAAGSLWDRIEPRLGPAPVARRRSFFRVATWQLAAACGVMAMIATLLVIDRPSRPEPVLAQRSPRPANELTTVDQSWLRPLLGVMTQSVTPELARKFGLHSLSGALIAEVVPGSTADRLGLRTGDVIVGVDGVQVLSPEQLSAAIGRRRAGQSVELDIVRGGKWIRKEARLGSGSNPERAPSKQSAPDGRSDGWPPVDAVARPWMDSAGLA